MFTGASVAAFILAIRPYLSRSAIVLCLISPPVVRGVFTGQVCAMLAAMLIWACGTTNRIAAGIAFGIIASIKPQLVIMAPLLLALNRDWRAFSASAFTFLALVTLSLIVLGPQRWPEWVASMGHFYRAVTGTGIITVGITPATIAERFGLPVVPAHLLGVLAGAIVVYACRELGPLEKATAIALGSLMAAPYALVYDLTAVVPLLALSIIRGQILATLGIASSFHPLPLVITAFELVTKGVSSERERAGQGLRKT
jgi:hypothetical protein